MTALTADYDPKYSRGDFVNAKATANSTIYAGGLCIRTTDTGYVLAGSDAANSTFAGVADDHITSQAGNANVTLRRTGVYEYTFSGTATEATVGSEVCVVDDQTVALAATTANDIKCGRIVEFVSATKVRIAIDGYC